MSESLVIIPTYNERENIILVIEKLLNLDNDTDILVIDDNSPDGTATVVKEIMTHSKKIFILEREKKLGLGTAYVTGFKWALEKKYTYIIEMDADLSHNPEDVSRLINECKKGVDLAIGSRYCNGVNVIAWPLRRLLLSYGASKYTRIITGMPIKDPTAGFKCFHRRVLEYINLDSIKSSGYSFQIEMHFRVWKTGFLIKEIPIIFTERTEGQSKMSKNIVFEAIFMVWKLKFSSLRGYIN